MLSDSRGNELNADNYEENGSSERQENIEEWEEEYMEEMEEGLENSENEEDGNNENNLEEGSELSGTGYENKKLTKRQWMSRNNFPEGESFHMQLPDKKPRKKRTLLMTEEQQIKKMEKVLLFVFFIRFFLLASLVYLIQFNFWERFFAKVQL